MRTPSSAAPSVRPSRPRRELGRRASFWVCAAVVAHTLWTSAAPAMSYPLYARLWHLTPTVTTGIFAVYPVTVVLTLLLFGNLSDHVGRRLVMMAGVTASLLGVAMFILADGVAWVYAGRALMGIGVGLSAGPSTAAVVEFSLPGQQGRANMIATAASALGLGSATLLGGGLIQYAPWPLRLDFVVLLVVLAVLLALTWFLPRPSARARATASRWRPGAVVVPRSIATVFAVAATSVTASYVNGALTLSLGAQIARDLIGSSNTLVNGAVISLFALSTGSTAIVARRLPSTPSIVAGGVASAVAMGLLMLAARWHALDAFLVSSALAGVGYSLLFLGGLTVINAHAPLHHRAGTLSGIYLIGYLLMGTVAMVLGVTATHHGLHAAIALGAPAIGGLGLLAALLAVVGTPSPSRADDAVRATA